MIYFHHVLLRVCLLLLLSAGISWQVRGEYSDREELRSEVMGMKTIVTPVFNDRVEEYIQWYENGPQTYMSELNRRSQLYFPYLDYQFQHAGIPEELKYLAVVESTLDPTIHSHVGAAGLWQFMKPTARYLGLRVDNYVDERLDPYKSTTAAIIYLKELYRQFEDWSLVLAAYNSGPGRVRSAMRKANSSSYEDIQEFLPKETQKYVPKFIAAQYFFTKGDWSTFVPSPISHDLIFTTEIPLTRAITLQEIAEELPVDLEILKDLNPSWKRKRVGNIKGTYQIRIPSRIVNDFLVWEGKNSHSLLDQSEDEGILIPLMKPVYHAFYVRVEKGSSLTEIAELFQLPPYLLHYWNEIGQIETFSHTRWIRIVLPMHTECAYVAEMYRQRHNLASLPYFALQPLASLEVPTTHTIEVMELKMPLISVNLGQEKTSFTPVGLGRRQWLSSQGRSK